MHAERDSGILQGVQSPRHARILMPTRQGAIPFRGVVIPCRMNCSVRPELLTGKVRLKGYKKSFSVMALN